MNRLADNVVKLIGSTQVITSVYSVVKELIENSFDAGATSVEVKLVNYGHDVIEVRDNGSGISKSDVPVFAKRYYTSKIRSHQDLEALTSYGFRGEALASLCAVSEVTVTTKTASDTVSLVYTLSGDGDITGTLPSHLGQGTTVCVKNLFKNLPVRKQFHNAVKQKKEDLKNVEKLLLAYAVILPKVRLSLRHNKEVIWQKPPLENTAAVLQSFLGRAVMAQMEWHKKQVKELEMTIEACLPKPGSDVSSLSRSSPERSFVVVNSRPVMLKEIDKLIRRYYSNCHACDQNCRPTYFVWITLPTKDVDVNLEPNKTTVMTTNMNLLKEQLEEMLLYVYGPLDNAPSWRYRDAGDKQDKAVESLAGTTPSPGLELPRAANREEGTSAKEFLENSSSLCCHSNNNAKETEDRVANQPLVICDKDFNTVSKIRTVGESVSVNPKSAESCQHLSDSRNLASHLIHRTVPEVCLPNTTADSVETDILRQMSTVRNQTSEVEPKNGSTDDQKEVEHKNQNPSEQCIGERTGFADSHFDTGLAKAIVRKTGDVDPEADTLAARSDQQTGSGQESMHEADVLLMPAMAGSSGSGAVLGPESGDGAEGSKSAGGLHWSLGTSVTSAQGPVQPVVLLAPSSGHCLGKRPLTLSPEEQTAVLKAPPEKQGRKLSPAQTTLYDIINNSAVKRPLSAKDLFMKEKRRSVVEQNPTADYETVTRIMNSLWEGLTDEQRMGYHRKCWQDKKGHKKALSNIRDMVAASSDMVAASRDMVAASSTQPCRKNAARRRPPQFASVTDTPFSMKQLRCSVLSDSLSRQGAVVATTVIGHIPSCDVYVCTRGSDICLLNAHRLSEVVVYDRLLHQHQLPICHCQPVRLTPSNTNGYWWVLEQLDSSQTPSTTTFTDLSDPRIVANGFNLKSWKDGEGKLCVELVGLCGDVPTYCYKDLVEVLELLAKDMSSSIARSRPLKVVHYLKGEAVRMVRGQAGEQSKEDIQELLNRAAVVVPLDRSACLHSRPFFHTLLTEWDATAASPKS